MIPRPIYYKNKTDFLNSNSNYLESTCQYYNDIVYIEDTEEIYTHGKIFGDKGIQLNLYDLLTGDTATKQAYYQMLKDQYDKDPDRPVIAYFYGNDGEKDIHLYKRPLLFQYISSTNSFSAPIWQIKTDSDDFEVSYTTISSTGEFVQGARTIVTKDMIYNGLDQTTVGWALDATQGKILTEKIADLIYTLEVTELDTEVTISDKEFEKIIACKGLKLIINGDEYMMFKRTIITDGSLTQYENSYIIGPNSFKVVITFTNSSKTYYCSQAVVSVQADSANTATDLSGRIEATPEVFIYRPSAGDKSIKDDNAFIRRVKGNSIIMNQIVPDVMTIQDGTGSLADHTYTITPTGSYPGINSSFNKLIPDGHKLFISIGLRIEGVANPRIGINIQGGFNTSLYYTQNDTGLTNFEQIITITGATNSNLVFFADASATLITIARPQIFDLTAMFGTGNEPTTVEEFRALYPNSYYPYNAGELRNLVCSGIKTVGFNEFNGVYARVLRGETYYLGGEYTSIGFTAELGGTTETITIPSNKLYTPTETGYIYATGTDICINLSHTGYRDGEYEPYKEVTHALPLSQITNGQPLRKAGSVYDEINDTEYIKRVGVVDLGSLTWSYTSNNNFFTCYNIPNMKITNTDGDRLDGLFCAKYLIDTNVTISTQATDKTMKRHNGWLHIRDTSFTDAASFKASVSGILLHYELAEPIVTPITTPIDFNYYVEDFGTEEAILAENSAPFSADIIYQFNAVDRIRQNDLNIDRLEEKVLALPSEFKTINGNSIIGSGDLIITAGNVGTEDDDGGLDDVNTQTYLRYVEQSLTDEQKLQARINIGASSNIIIGNATQDITSLQHNTLLKWNEDGTTESMALEFPTNNDSTVLNCGFLLYLTPDATSDYSLHLDGTDIYWANNIIPDLEPEYYYEMWFTSYDGGGTWFGVFTKYTM